MNRLSQLLLTTLLLTFCTASFAQSNTSALVPMPNHIVKSKNGATTKLDKSTVIATSLPNDCFIVQKLISIIEKHMQLSHE